MEKIIAAVVVVLALVGGYFYWSSTATAPATDTTPAMGEVGAVGAPTDTSVNTDSPTVAAPTGEVKEFTMTAFYDEKGVWFSLKDMAVKKGDTVRIKATNTKGMHDFTLDEFGVKKELPLNEEVVIEFVADKVGDFEYYCSKMDHRAKGQWGTLKVTE